MNKENKYSNVVVYLLSENAATVFYRCTGILLFSPFSVLFNETIHCSHFLRHITRSRTVVTLHKNIWIGNLGYLSGYHTQWNNPLLTISTLQNKIFRLCNMIYIFKFYIVSITKIYTFIRWKLRDHTKERGKNYMLITLFLPARIWTFSKPAYMIGPLKWRYQYAMK